VQPLSFDEAAGKVAEVQEGIIGLQFAEADLLAYLLAESGSLSQVAASTGMSRYQVRTRIAVAERFPEAHRHPTLTWRHYELLLKGNAAPGTCCEAADKDLSTRGLKKHIGWVKAPPDLDADERVLGNDARRFNERWDGTARAEVTIKHLEASDGAE